MKQFFSLIACAFTFMLTSCQFSENIYINEDGSGKMEFTMDASEMMQMAGDIGRGQPTEGMDKPMDSTIVFKDFIREYKDSISTLSVEDQKNIRALEDFKMHMVMNPDTNEMTFDLSRDFEDAKELKNMFKTMSEVGSLNRMSAASSGANPVSGIGSGEATDIQYSFDGTVFKRSAKIIDSEKHAKEIDSLGQSAMMFGSSTYKINYHFPRAVKSFSKEGALFSEDRKTITFEVGFLDVLKDPELLDFEIILEDK